METDWVQRIGRFKKIFTGIVIFFAVFTLFGFFGLPPIVKSLLSKKLSEALHREVTIEQIKINPYALSLTVRGFLVKDKGGSEKFVSFDELYVNLQSISALKFALVLREIIPNFWFWIERQGTGNINSLIKLSNTCLRGMYWWLTIPR